jgi:hypothetical protein
MQHKSTTDRPKSYSLTPRIASFPTASHQPNISVTLRAAILCSRNLNSCSSSSSNACTLRPNRSSQARADHRSFPEAMQPLSSKSGPRMLGLRESVTGEEQFLHWEVTVLAYMGIPQLRGCYLRAARELQERVEDVPFSHHEHVPAVQEREGDFNYDEAQGTCK